MVQCNFYLCLCLLALSLVHSTTIESKLSSSSLDSKEEIENNVEFSYPTPEEILGTDHYVEMDIDDVDEMIGFYEEVERVLAEIDEPTVDVFGDELTEEEAAYKASNFAGEQDDMDEGDLLYIFEGGNFTTTSINDEGKEKYWESSRSS